MEMMARLDNFGPFHVFYTLSCADFRWPENLTSILCERGIGLRCSIDDDMRETYEVLSDSRDWITMEDYITEEMDETLHEVLRRNVVTAAHNYQARVQALMQTIVRNPSNPLSVKHFSTKLEFASHGAGHNHGVLWLDMDKIEQKVDLHQLYKERKDIAALTALCQINNKMDHYLKNPSDVSENLDEFLTSREISIEHTKKSEKHKTLKMLQTMEQETELDERDQTILQDLKLLYPLFGLKASLRKLHEGEDISKEEIATVTMFIDSFSTVSLHPAIVGDIVAKIAQKVNRHHHTKTCRKYQTACRFKFPKLPSVKTIIAIPSSKNVTESEKKSLEAKHSVVIKKVKEVLDNKDLIKLILEEHSKESENTELEAIEGRTKRIDAVLNMAGLNTDEEKARYHQALSYSSSGYTVVMARDIDELYVNSYNPEITRAWDGNTDFQICLDFYAIITYITEYYAKDDTGIVKVLVNTLKASNCNDLKEEMKLLMNTWIRNRQMGEAEAVYRLTKEFHFRDSDTKCVFVQTCPRSERSKILRNVTGKPEYDNIKKVFVDNHKEGVYIEQYDINSKYERRPLEDYPILNHLSLAQFVKIYESFWGNKTEEKKSCDEENNESIDEEETMNETCASQEYTISHSVVPPVSSVAQGGHCNSTQSINHPMVPPVSFVALGGLGDTKTEEEEGEEIDENKKFHHIMATDWKKGHGPSLPKMFKLKDPYPGEPPFMRLRRKPAVLRFHKYKVDKDPKAYWFSEAMLYVPHHDEEDLVNKIDQAYAGGTEMWDAFVKRIGHVKSQVMEYLEDNEEARMMAAEMMIDNALTGEFWDPEGEQENEDNRQDTIMQQEEFEHLDPDYFEQPAENVFEKSFHPIEVRPLQELCKSAQRLDFYQRKVLELGIRHARSLVKARGGKNPPPSEAPLCMVDGAAGAGKSSTIHVLKEMIQLIMQQPGDNLECPYILLCAPTGTAAVNIKGQTLHSTFGFTFGDEHYSLPDKTRDTKRALFKNLKFLIIDEVSMVKADQLYQLDLRLREITMHPGKLFGDVALFVFGDIMQLKPVMGRYIWCQPRSSEYLHAFLIDPHWEKFCVISLVENHRQKHDAEYANILNRIRIGEHTDDDMTVLQERVHPENHPDMKGALVIACTHKIVNKHNTVCLQQLNSELIEIEAINSHSNLHGYIPKLHKNKNTIEATPYLQTLHLKVGCRVMLTVNLDVKDLLCNGSIGTLGAIIKDKNGEVRVLMVKFDSDDIGKEM